MRKALLLALLLPLYSLYSQDTSSLYNQAFNELSTLEQNLTEQELIISGLLKSQEEQLKLLKNVEASLEVAEAQSKNLEVSLLFYKKQTIVFKIVVGILGTIVIGESLYIMIPK